MSKEKSELKKEVEEDTITKLAETAYEVVRAYEKVNHNTKDPSWEDLGDYLRESMCTSVRLLRDSEKTSPATLHELWVDSLVCEGWTYGKTINLEERTHTDLVNFRSLRPLERAKYKLFYETVSVGNIDNYKVRVVG